MIKRRASSSLSELLAERFRARNCPISEIRTPIGPINFHHAYDDNAGSGLVLVLGNLRRSKTAYNRVAGLIRPGPNTGWIERMRSQPDVLIATALEGGGLVVWKSLPSRESVLAHMEALRQVI